MRALRSRARRTRPPRSRTRSDKNTRTAAHCPRTSARGRCASAPCRLSSWEARLSVHFARAAGRPRDRPRTWRWRRAPRLRPGRTAPDRTSGEKKTSSSSSIVCPACWASTRLCHVKNATFRFGQPGRLDLQQPVFQLLPEARGRPVLDREAGPFGDAVVFAAEEPDQLVAELERRTAGPCLRLPRL